MVNVKDEDHALQHSLLEVFIVYISLLILWNAFAGMICHIAHNVTKFFDIAQLSNMKIEIDGIFTLHYFSHNEIPRNRCASSSLPLAKEWELVGN